VDAPLDLASWLVDDFDETVGRLASQVFGRVPPERRKEHADGGGSSLDWVCVHVERHATLALAVLEESPEAASAVGLDGGAGLEEAEQPWAVDLDSLIVEAQARETFRRVRMYLARVGPEALTRVPDAEGVLDAAGVARDEYGWLYQMWRGRPAAFLVRWPLTGHLTNHVGEMIATRNRMGLSPF
jgi:hypothetical protein